MEPVYNNTLKLGTLLNEYRLESMLGMGGFGLTYLAWDTHLEKNVAIKEYLPGDLAVRALDGSVVPVSSDHQHDYKWGLDRFIMEARTLAKFSHGNIVRVNRYFEANGTGYMVMDYEEGESLSQRLKRAPQPPETEIIAMLMPLLDGLTAVHETGFLHRDIKPSNIFIRKNGSPVLLDFGAARHAVVGHTKSLTAVLTPGFAPIEQYTNEGRQGPWSDLYAMSGVVFRAMTNQNPPDAVSRLQTDKVQGMLNAVRDRYSERLLNAVRWGMSPQQNDRPQRVQEWRNVLTSTAPIPAPAPAPAPAMAQASARPASVSGVTSVDVSAQARRRQAARPSAPDLTPPGSVFGRWGWVLAGVAIASGLVWMSDRSSSKSAAPVNVVTVARPAPEPAPAPRDPAEPVPPAAGDAPRAEAPPTMAVEPPYPARDAGMNVASAPPVPGPSPSPSPSSSPSRDLYPDRPDRDRSVAPGDFSRMDTSQIERTARVEFAQGDSNGDGYLSMNEAGRFPFLYKEYQRVDRDHDGRISADEFVQMRRVQAEAMRARLMK